MPHLHDALEAYRADLAYGGRGEPFSERDTIWLAWASALERASSLTGDARTESLRRAVADIPASLVDGSTTPTDLAQAEHVGHAATLHTLAVSKEAEEAGAYATATVILDLAQSTLPGGRGLLHGRLTAQQARILERVGDLDGAERLYDAVDTLGAELQSEELRYRAVLGRGMLARARGDPLAARALLQSVLDGDDAATELKAMAGSLIQELWFANMPGTAGSALESLRPSTAPPPPLSAADT